MGAGKPRPHSEEAAAIQRQEAVKKGVIILAKRRVLHLEKKKRPSERGPDARPQKKRKTDRERYPPPYTRNQKTGSFLVGAAQAPSYLQKDPVLGSPPGAEERCSSL